MVGVNSAPVSFCADLNDRLGVQPGPKLLVPLQHGALLRGQLGAGGQAGHGGEHDHPVTTETIRNSSVDGSGQRLCVLAAGHSLVP